MAYQIENISRTPIHENLDTKNVRGALEVLSIGVRERKTLTDAQWASKSVQAHIRQGRIRSKQQA